MDITIWYRNCQDVDGIIYEHLEEFGNVEYILQQIRQQPENPLNICLLSKLLSCGPSDQKQAIEHTIRFCMYHPLIHTGYPDALYGMAGLYDTEHDIPKAIELYQQAIDKGHVNSMVQLAIIYEDNKKYQNLPKAIELYQQAVDKGHVDSMYYLAAIYKDNEEYRNLPKAIELLNQAVDKGHVDSMCYLAGIYENDIEYQNLPKAIELLKQAVDKGHVDSMYYLAVIYEDNKKYQNLPKAIELYQQAVDKGHVDSMYYLAAIYKDNEEYQNLPKTIELYQQAVDKGHVDSMYYLAAIYKDNKKFQNLPKAIELYVRCLEHGDGRAQSRLCEISFYHSDDMIQMVIDLRNEKNILSGELEKSQKYITELEYSPDGPGYLKAKAEWDSLIRENM